MTSVTRVQEEGKEGSWEKLTRKFKEQPLVPIGIAATCAALIGATVSLRQRNRTQFNKFLRYRVAAQGLTVLAALGGSIYFSEQKRKENQEQRDVAKAARLAREEGQGQGQLAVASVKESVAQPTTEKK